MPQPRPKLVWTTPANKKVASDPVEWTASERLGEPVPRVFDQCHSLFHMSLVLWGVLAGICATVLSVLAMK